MKKFFHFFSWPLTGLLTTLAFAACTDTDSLSDGLVYGNTGNPEDALSFSTYIGGNLKETRAGATGSIDTKVLKGADYGFGVFGYYTGKITYNEFRKQGGDDKFYPNFMYNQKVTYDAIREDAGYATEWVYSPIKYWPNDIQAGDVDDQTNDQSKDPAQGDGNNGGRISFFAYAPYVKEASQENATSIDGFKTSTNPDETGILSFSGNKFNGKTGYYSDPYVTYRIPANSKDVVDLLWGTAHNSDINVVGQLNDGVTGDGTSDPDATTGYEKNIYQTYTTNADMTKQTTKGLVRFLFKHALSKVGGSYTGENEETSADDDPNTKPNGLMVVLDLDDEKGAEDGGELEKYLAYDNLEPGSDAAKNKYNTKVTVEEIKLSSTSQLTDAGVAAVAAGEKITTTTTYYEAIENKGLFNLATGQWTNREHKDDLSQVIQTSAGTDENGDPILATGADAVLHENIAEPTTAPDYTKTDFEQKLPIGVTTVPKNVYGDDGAPFVFIPGTRPIIEISITYVVRTYDPNLGDVYSEVRQRITKNLYITTPVELNKQYNILIHLGLTSVKFTATVSNWDVATKDTPTTTTDPETGETITTYEEEIEHVWLPRNVGDATKDVSFVGKRFNGTEGTDYKEIGGAQYFSSQGGQAISFSQPQVDGKNINHMHIAMSSKDREGNDVDWVTFQKTSNFHHVNLAPNPTLKERTAKIYATYDNKTTEVMTITQRPSFINEATVSLDREGATPNTVPSAAATYPTKLHVTKTVAVKADGTAETTPTGVDLTLTKGYNLTESIDWITINGEKAQSLDIAANASLATRVSESDITATYQYNAGDASLSYTTTNEFKITQEAGTIGSITLTLPGDAKSYTASNYQSGTVDYTLTATIVDNNNKTIGTTNPAAGDYTISSDWVTASTKSDGNGTLSFGENTGAKRETTVTATYAGKTDNVTIIQPAAELRINVNSAAPIQPTANSDARVTSVIMNEAASNVNVTAACTFYIKCNDGGSWASIDKNTGVITVQANGSGAQRSVTVTAVHSSGVSKTRVLNQAAN